MLARLKEIISVFFRQKKAHLSLIGGVRQFTQMLSIQQEILHSRSWDRNP